MKMVKALEVIFLSPGDVLCDWAGVEQANNRDLVRMLVNSFVWAAVGGIVVAVVV
jgi:hypothetical protein